MLHDINERQQQIAMASANNPNEPIIVGESEAIKAHSQTLQTQELSPLPPIDQHQTRLTEALPSIDIAYSPNGKEPSPQNDLLSPADQYASEYASLNLNYQDIWEESMEDVGSTRTPHKKTAVLMVSWAKELDELDTGPEVKELAHTFRNRFHYAVRDVELNATKLPQHQFSAHLAEFIRDFDSESTLLIVYYAGMILRSIFQSIG